MIRVYLAAPWADRELMFERAAKFDMVGEFEITQRWWEKASGLSESGYTGDRVRAYAEEDMKGALDAEVVVVFQTSLSEGKAVEQGIALAKGTPIVSIGTIGQVKNIFHFLPQYIWVDNIEEAIAKCIQLKSH